MSRVIRNLERASRLLWRVGRGIGTLERDFYARVVMPKLASVPAPAAPNLNVDVVSLVCASAVDMAIWTARSLDYFSGYRWSQVWIDDGTLTPAIVERAKAALPRLRVISHVEGQDILAKLLAPYPTCQRAAADHPIFRRAFLLAEVMRGDRAVCVDTDVLFFADPKEILAWATAPVATARFMHDPITFYFPRLGKLTEWYGSPVTDHVNGGLNLVPAGWHDLDLTERFLAAFWDTPRRSWHIEQSILALQMTRLNGTALSGEHEVSFLPERLPYCVARHYVSAGPVRDYFYTEGIALLSRFRLAKPDTGIGAHSRATESAVLLA